MIEGEIVKARIARDASVAVLDALKGTKMRTVEVHLTEPKVREDFRRVSYVGMVAETCFSGLGFESYGEAIRYLVGKKA